MVKSNKLNDIVQSRITLSNKTNSFLKQYAKDKKIPLSQAIEELVLKSYKDYMKQQLREMENEGQ